MWLGIISINYNQPRKHFSQFCTSMFNSNGNFIWKGVWVGIVETEE